MTFEEAVRVILDLEGGYSNNPRDPGGETNFGIAKKWHPDLDVKNMSRKDAMDIYKEEYWNAMSLEFFPPSLRLMLFDCAVNQGVTKAKEFACTAFGISRYYRLDKLYFDTLPSTDIKPALIRIAQLRLNAYYSTKNYDTFGKGWLSRLMFVCLKTNM